MDESGLFITWKRQDSNPPSSRCWRDALPDKLLPHIIMIQHKIESQSWREVSNLRPYGYESYALTTWATPRWWWWISITIQWKPCLHGLVETMGIEPVTIFVRGRIATLEHVSPKRIWAFTRNRTEIDCLLNSCTNHYAIKARGEQRESNPQDVSHRGHNLMSQNRIDLTHGDHDGSRTRSISILLDMQVFKP